MSNKLEIDDCPRCGKIFGLGDEVCQNCGFDPVDNPEDEAEYERHLARKKELRDASRE